jgi:hypothetical protein
MLALKLYTVSKLADFSVFSFLFLKVLQALLPLSLQSLLPPWREEVEVSEILFGGQSSIGSIPRPTEK